MDTNALSPSSNDDGVALPTSLKGVITAPVNALTPPTSEDMNSKMDDGSSDLSELSDLEDDDDEEEIVPDHYYDGGKIPVFKPVRITYKRESWRLCALHHTVFADMRKDNGSISQLQEVHRQD